MRDGYGPGKSWPFAWTCTCEVDKMIIHVLIGAAIGGVLGGLMGSTRSCGDGGCPLTANPRRGAIYGAIMGTLFALSISAGQ